MNASSDLTGANPTDALWPQQAAVLLWQLLQHAGAQMLGDQHTSPPGLAG